MNWKTIAAVVEGAVLWGLQHRRWNPLHVIGIDEVKLARMLRAHLDGVLVWTKLRVAPRRPTTSVRRVVATSPITTIGPPGSACRDVLEKPPQPPP